MRGFVQGSCLPLRRPVPSLVVMQNKSGEPCQAFGAGGRSVSYCCLCRRHLVVVGKILPSHLRAQHPAFDDYFAEQRQNMHGESLFMQMILTIQ